jgi:hypothetical protein
MQHRQGITVEEWVEATQITTRDSQSARASSLQLEAVLGGFFDGVEMLKKLHSYGRTLGLVSTKNVVLHRDAQRIAYQIKFLCHSLDATQRPPERDYRTPQGDIWGAGVVLFTLLTGIPTRESRLGRMPETERLMYIRQTVNDLALSELVTMCCSDLENRKTCEEIMSHVCVRWWVQPSSAVLNLALLHAANTQLKFSSKRLKTKAVKAIFTLATLHFSAVFSYIQIHSVDWAQLIWVFVEDKLSAVAAKGGLLLFVSALKHSKGSRRLMLKAGIIDKLLQLRSTIGFAPLAAFFGELCLKGTCTVPVLLYHNKVHLEAFKNYKTCLHSQNLLLNSAPYYGLNSVRLIIFGYERNYWSSSKAIEMLLKVPFHFLVLHKQAVLQLIETCVECLVFTQLNFSCSLNNALKLLSCVTCILEVFEHTSQRGSCLSSPEIAYALELTRCPLVLFCVECAVPVCVYCGATCHKACRLSPLHPTSSYMSCRCPKEHNDDKGQYPVFALKKRGLFIFKTLNQTHVETLDVDTYKVTCTGNHGEAVSIESLVLPSSEHKDRTTVFYFEAKVITAGVRDALSIGLEGLQYQSWDGQIVDSDLRVLLRAPPYGSHDSVGVGITADSQGYFTLNGLMMHPLLPVLSSKLKVKFYSEDTSVLLQLNPSQCVFLPQELAQMTDLRVRAAMKIPQSLKDKLESLLMENYDSFEEENSLDSLLVFLSSQFSGEIGRAVLDRTISSKALRVSEEAQCLMQ